MKNYHHVVGPSPWPLLMSIGISIIAIGLILLASLCMCPHYSVYVRSTLLYYSFLGLNVLYLGCLLGYHLILQSEAKVQWKSTLKKLRNLLVVLWIIILFYHIFVVWRKIIYFHQEQIALLFEGNLPNPFGIYKEGEVISVWYKNIPEKNWTRMGYLVEVKNGAIKFVVYYMKGFPPTPKEISYMEWFKNLVFKLCYKAHNHLLSFPCWK